MKKSDSNIQKQIQKLGKRIRELRKKKGFNNSEFFAYEHRINRSQYGKYEVGVDMKFSSLLRISKALDVSVSELLEIF